MNGDDIRTALQAKVFKAVNELLQATGAEAFALVIPNSDPSMFVAAGTEHSIRALMTRQAAAEGAG